AEDGIRDATVTGVQTCALPIWFFARLRTASSIVRAPKSACALKRDDVPIVGMPVEATVTAASAGGAFGATAEPFTPETAARRRTDRKSTRLNSSHGSISYAVFC